MVSLSEQELNEIIKKHWPKTTPTAGMHKMMRDAADLAFKQLLAVEAEQEPVASYVMSCPNPVHASVKLLNDKIAQLESQLASKDRLNASLQAKLEDALWQLNPNRPHV